MVVEREFRTSRYHQGYIEPHNATALWNQDGRLTIWTSTQGMFGDRRSISEVLQMPVSQITVNAMEIGGGFGGKNPIYLEPLAALLAKKTGRPVKMTMTRDEVFEGTGPDLRHLQSGSRWARSATAPSSPPRPTWPTRPAPIPGSPLNGGMNGVFAPYNIPNRRGRRLRRRRSTSPRRRPTARRARRPACSPPSP